MGTSIEMLEAEVLQLPNAERSRLLERLITSFDPEPAIREAWIREAERRDAELDAGVTKSVPADEALSRIRASLR